MKKPYAQELSRNKPILHFDVILQHDWPIEQRLLHNYKGFLWWEKEEAMVWSFHLLADETNNKRLITETIFKVIRNSL